MGARSRKPAEDRDLSRHEPADFVGVEHADVQPEVIEFSRKRIEIGLESADREAFRSQPLSCGSDP